MEATEGSSVASSPGPDQEARLVRSERGRQRGELSIQRRREMRVSLVLFLEKEGSCIKTEFALTNIFFLFL